LAFSPCHADGVWHTLPLRVRVETAIDEDRYPHLFALAQALDDNETYAIVLADAQESRIFVAALDSAVQAGETEAPEQIKRFRSGKAQENDLLQHRTDNIIKAHTKDIAEELGQVMARYDVRHVVIAANDSIKGIVMGALPDTVKEKLVDYVHLDLTATLAQIVEELAPTMQRVEREQEAAIVAELEEQNYPDGLGVAGVAATALALSKGQVRALLIGRSFAGAGGECPTCRSLRAGQRLHCPYDGTPLRHVDLREALIARAAQQSAAIEIVESSDYLDQHEGVGALLRYRDNERAVQ